MINKTKLSILTATAMGSLMFTATGQAVDLTASSGIPFLNFDDTVTPGGRLG